MAERLKSMLEQDYGVPEVRLGHLDITFYRDDFRRSEKPLEANSTKIDFVVEDTKVVFVSGYAEDAFGDDSEMLPNSVFLPKPFSLNQLTATVQGQLH